VRDRVTDLETSLANCEAVVYGERAPVLIVAVRANKVLGVLGVASSFAHAEPMVASTAIDSHEPVVSG
jgi:hypothetical protein